ncbi:mitochondrial import receptor subunit TOM20 homolog [Pomacea canaliculata]|uniref:mitochondrial import receptor subunit TOM20 homolog n=1 Tax=Pomacea canaliculata TaxID=400727 RepID=UPI000D7303FA|nr:mitochondrial import receptor subunit TOM20 homolog [Pomacea canaliculata]
MRLRHYLLRFGLPYNFYLQRGIEMMSRTTLGIAAAGAGLCFIGYCIYFDQKRRSDPDFKQKLREKRKKLRQQKQAQSKTQLPDLSSPEAMQRFFLQEVQQGEELLAAGDIENGVEHLSNAVAVCGQPQQLLQVLQQTLPPQVFQLLIQRLPSAGQRLMMSSAAAGGGDQSASLEEDDLE